MTTRLTVILLAATLFFSCCTVSAADLALVGATIYLSPTEPPIENGSILTHDGKIMAVGPAAKITIPRDATIIDCKGLIITAGFWNSHVHILPPALLHSETHSSAQLTAQLEAMFTRWGFTTVFDIASIQQNTNQIRSRMQHGEIKGPRILTTGEPFWGKGGTPIYVKDFIAANHISIPDAESPAQAVERVRQQIHDGADGIKIFANSVEQNGILTMPLDLAQAIVGEAHSAGKPLFAHVSNNPGIEVALKSGVDILAHTTPADTLWTKAFAERLVAAHLALTPTLTLWDVEGKRSHVSAAGIEGGMRLAAGQLQSFAEAGGQVLFGTDAGYIEQYDTSEEFAWMARAGMNYSQILASLTTNPAQRFGYASHSGRIAQGMDADLAVLSEDPAVNVAAFSKVRYTIRAGEIIFSKP